MTSTQLIKIISEIIIHFPLGKIVWHKANGSKGIVQGYEIDANGGACIIVDYGHNLTAAEYAQALSFDKIIIDDEGEEWKEKS